MEEVGRSVDRRFLQTCLLTEPWLLTGDEEKEYHVTRANHFASTHIDNKLGRGRDSRDSRDSRGGGRDRDSSGRGRGGRGRGARGGGGGRRDGGRDRDRNDNRDRSSPRKEGKSSEDSKAPTSISIAPFDEMPVDSKPAVKREREDGEESAAKKAKTE